MAGPTLRRARCAFLTSPLPASFTRQAASPAVCRRRAQTPRCAKIQPAQESSSPSGEDGGASLRPPPGAEPDPAVRPPPGALPTLSSLSGMGVAEEREEAEPEVTLQGVGLSVSEEDDLKSFLKEVYAEFRVIEWPTVGRVVKVTLIVIATMIIASAGIYTVDGFFLSISKQVFER